ncbi:MAG: phosphate/phosphite/phosphonate ABC transporter substrate-binding protein [Planctomycetota bacterium]
MTAAPMFASLPWYDLPEAQEWTDAWWRVLRGHLRTAGFDVTAALERSVPYEEQWRSPALLLSQSCGYDVQGPFARDLQLLATPCYAAVGCHGVHYASYVVVRADAPWQRLDELRATRCVINTATSHSGMNILRAMVAPLCEDGRFFASVARSGSHRRSLRAIERGMADVAAIDCVTWALLQRHAPHELQGLRILCRTTERPAPPYVTRRGLDDDGVQRLRQALFAAAADPTGARARDELLLDCFVPLPLAAYDSIGALQRLADAHGYGEMAALEPGSEDA